MESSMTGIVFERYVTRMLDDLGKIHVRHDRTLRRDTAEGMTRSQFDIVTGAIFRHYYECKFHLNGSKVTFGDTSTFGAKLRLNGINYRRGIMITNTGYDTRARAYARQAGITLIDREGLVLMDWERSHQLLSLVKGPPKSFERGLEQRILSYR